MKFQFGEITLRPRVVNRLGARILQSPLRCGIQMNEAGLDNSNFITPQYALVYIIHGEGFYEDEQHGRLQV